MTGRGRFDVTRPALRAPSHRVRLHPQRHPATQGTQARHGRPIRGPCALTSMASESAYVHLSWGAVASDTRGASGAAPPRSPPDACLLSYCRHIGLSTSVGVNQHVQETRWRGARRKRREGDALRCCVNLRERVNGLCGPTCVQSASSRGTAAIASSSR